MSLSLAQASAMAAKMAVAAEMTMPGSGTCHSYDGDDLGADTGACLALCAFTTPGLLTGEPATPPGVFRASFPTACSLFGGRTTTPDPGPPKTLTLV
jgi:hypothetical protein